MYTEVARKAHNFRRRVESAITRAVANAVVGTQKVRHWIDPDIAKANVLWNMMESKARRISTARGDVACANMSMPMAVVGFTYEAVRRPRNMKHRKLTYAVQFGSVITLLCGSTLSIPRGFPVVTNRDSGDREVSAQLNWERTDGWSWALDALVLPGVATGVVCHPCNYAGIAMVAKLLIDENKWE